MEREKASEVAARDWETCALLFSHTKEVLLSLQVQSPSGSSGGGSMRLPEVIRRQEFEHGTTLHDEGLSRAGKIQATVGSRDGARCYRHTIQTLRIGFLSIGKCIALEHPRIMEPIEEVPHNR